jgi:small-conductance mechanosensitive channel
MIQSLVSHLCLATLVAWWGLVMLHAPWSVAQAVEATKPEAAKSEGGSYVEESDEEKKAAAELIGLREKVKAVAQALETTKKELAPRVREAQSHVQHVRAALQKAIGPDESKALEEELRVAQESLSLLELELALGEEEVTVAEGMVAVAEKRAIQLRATEQQGEEDKDDSLTAQEARVATEEAKIAAERVSLAEGRVGTLQDELYAIEKEVAEHHVLVTTVNQEMKSVTDTLATHSGGEEKDLLERQLRRAKRRAEILQKRTNLIQRQLELTRSKYELAQREHELLTVDMEMLEGRAQSIRDTVGVSLDDIKAEQEQAMALPMMLLVVTLLMMWLAADGGKVFVLFAITMSGLAGYTFLTGVARELFMPWDPQQRLIACRNGIASYLYRHLHRISAYVSAFLTIIVILRAVNYHEGLLALMAVLFYLGLLVLLVLLTSNKEAILSLLPNAHNRGEKIIYVAATQVYPLVILLGICIIALQSLGYVNLSHFLLTGALLTGLILAAAYFVSKGMNKLLRWWLLPEGHAEGDFLFGREATETFYTILSHAVGSIAYLIAIVMIAGTWGVDLSGVYAMLTSPTAQGYYRRLLAAIMVISVSTVILRTAYYVIDKVFNISPEEARAWRKKIALGDKGKTIAPLLKNLLKYCTIFVGGVLVLRVLGVDPTPIIAGAGVVGLAVGFGAQTLVKDVISGFFLLFEGLIAVGDGISFGNSSGVVEEVGLRVTKYRTFSGELWVIPNGEIRAFGNSNRQWMRAVVVVGVGYEQDISKAMRVLDEIGKTWAAERRDIVLEPPQVQGILSFDESSVTLRLVVKVKSSHQGGAELELRRRIKEAFDREGIEIPFPRRVFYTRQETEGLNGEAQGLKRLSQRIQKVEDSQNST